MFKQWVILTDTFSRLLKERDELNDQVSSLQIEMGLKASPLEGNLYDTLHSLK